MMDWCDDADNQAVFDRLVDTLVTGKAVAFVGAGASAGLYPMWSKLIEELIQAALPSLHASEREGTAAYWRQEAGAAPEQIAQEIRDRMHEGRFAKLMASRFGPETGDDGKRFTVEHASLSRLPFAGYVTTNYDPGLEAAFACERGGWFLHTFAWHEDDVSRWYQGLGFGERVCPLLYAHGRFNQASKMVLTVDGYRAVYGDDGPYLRLFDRLWTTDTMLFVGFSFRDPWLTFWADRALNKTGVKVVSPPQHVAIMPLDVADCAQAHARRQRFRRQYHAELLLYPVTSKAGKSDHSALVGLLSDLEAAVSAAATTPSSTSPATISVPQDDPAKLLEHWCAEVRAEHHRLLDHFPGRPAELEILERAWVRLHVAVARDGTGGSEHAGEDVRDLRDMQRGRNTLDDFLELDRTDHAWVTGRWLIVGDPGAGKTTLLRHLAARLADDSHRRWVPVFVPLAKLVDPQRRILDYLEEEYGRQLGRGLAGLIDSLGKDGRLVVLLDAYDEVPPERRPRLAALLRRLERDWPDAAVVVTTRPLGMDDAAELEGFKTLALQELAEEDRQAFLETWFGKRADLDAQAEAEAACRHFDRERSLRALSLNPLHLTLLTVLWESGVRAPRRRSELFRAILNMLLSGEHGTEIAAREDTKRGRLEPELATRQVLGHIAHGMTEDDHYAEPVKRLAERLLDDDLDHARRRIEKVWGKGSRAFLDAVHQRTFILGPHDGARSDWRFWHRTFREALTAENLLERYQQGDEQTLLARFTDLDQDLGQDLGRWAEPLALLAGQVAKPDRLMRRLMEVNRTLGLRALATADGLDSDTLLELLGLNEDDVEKRREIFLAVPEQLDDPDACLALVERLGEDNTNGSDLFFLEWILDEVANRWPRHAERAARQRDHLFDHIPVPAGAAELFGTLVTPQGEGKDLWCKIPAGRGVIGSPKDVGDGDERPRHRVEITSAFWLGAVAVTRAQYLAFDPSKSFPPWQQGEDETDLRCHPAVTITWYEAVTFCRWLERRLGFAGARLPSEEEWEYACRAGTQTAYWSGDEEADGKRVGWFGQGIESGTQAVASLPANPWGLYDVHGNVWEWTVTPWDDERYQGRTLKSPFRVNPRQPSADLAAAPGLGRVVRGGSFWFDAVFARSAYRRNWFPGFVLVDQGFRVLLPRPPEIVDH